MAHEIIALTSALKTQLETELARSVYRKYLPYFAEQNVSFSDERVTVYPLTETAATSSRTLSEKRYEVGIQVIQTLPESGSQTRTDPDADINNLEFLDARMLTVKTIRDLFEGDGALTHADIGGCYYVGYEMPVLYNKEALLNRMFISTIVVTFMYSGSV